MAAIEDNDPVMLKGWFALLSMQARSRRIAVSQARANITRPIRREATVPETTVIITKYAVRYTGRQYGHDAVLTEEPLDPTSRVSATLMLDHTRQAQEEAGRTVDARIVTCTVTITDWAEENLPQA